MWQLSVLQTHPYVGLLLATKGVAWLAQAGAAAPRRQFWGEQMGDTDGSIHAADAPRL
jgi:hypothetical protein